MHQNVLGFPFQRKFLPKISETMDRKKLSQQVLEILNSSKRYKNQSKYVFLHYGTPIDGNITEDQIYFAMKEFP